MRLAHLFDKWTSSIIPHPLTLALQPANGAPLNFDERRASLSLMSSGGSDDIPTVTVQRRRRPTTPPDQRPTAEAPTRDERPPSGGGGSYPPPGGGGSYRPPSGGGPVLPGGGMGRVPGGGMGCIGLIAIIAIGGLFLLFTLLRGSGGNDIAQNVAPVGALPTLQSQAALPTQQPSILPTRQPQAQPTLDLSAGATGATTDPSLATAGGDTWTVMLYQDADDRVLEQDIYIDLNEAERIGSSDKVKIIAQIDRYKGGYSGDGDWTGAGRFLITRDDDLGQVRSEVLQDLGEVNMADGRTLVDFVTWAMKTYPADKYALIMSDHGMGWPGGFSDPDPQANPRVNAPLAQRLGNMMYLSELDAALTEIRKQTGLDKFELIGLDACLMSDLEVYTALAPHGRYAVASQETEPALGWAYTGLLNRLISNPAMTGADLSNAVVESYIIEDQRITDDRARAEFVGARGFGVPAASQLADQIGKDVTLSAVNLAAIPQLNAAVNDFAYTLQSENPKLVAQARQYAQAFTSIFGQNVPPSFIDLAHFAALVNRNSDNAQVKQQSENVVRALDAAVLSEKNGAGKPGAYGVSIYFPTSQLYTNDVAGPRSYTAIASRFANESLWDDYLANIYTGRTFNAADRSLVVPDQPIVAPAAGGITVAPIQKDATVASPNHPVLLSTEISGENVGYVKLMVGYLDAANKSLALLDTDYLESSESREMSGVYYPVWPEGGKFKMQFEWEPVVFAISNGDKNAVALFEPETYGRSFEEAVYTVDGLYTYADGEQRPAKLYFRNGEMFAVYGFNEGTGQGAPREIVPQLDDKFTIYEKWMDIDSQGKAMAVATEPGETLTFNGEPWKWVDLNAAPGDYVVGFIVEDIDGNEYPVYDQIKVTN